MPVDVTVEKPRARSYRYTVFGKEANCDSIPSVTHIHNIPDNGVVEIVPVQMNRMLLREIIAINLTMFYSNSKPLTGPPMTPVGMISSTLLLRSRP